MPAIKWFAYSFPNRRTDKTVVEVTINFSADDQYDFSRHTLAVKNTLTSSGILDPDEVFPEQALPRDRMGWYTSLLAQTALLFQRKAGHRVSFFSVDCDPDQNRGIALLEHEHCDVGLTAVKLAIEVVNVQRRFLAEPFQAFRKFALERLLPLDTEAIISAAHRRDIPSLRLEHLPYKREDFDELTGGECIRRNGLLMLGHGQHQHVLDGTFCLDLDPDYNGLRVNGSERQALLKKLGIAVVRPEDELADAQQYHLVAVNGQVTAVVNPSDRQWLPPEILDNSLIRNVVKINREVGFAPMVVSILTADISHPLAQGGGGVLDFELAPELDRYLKQNDSQAESLLASTADMVIDWLFHGKSQTRMPIIAITGTNGKTTTTRMVNRILMGAGLEPGMVCTDGVFFNGQKVSEGDQCTVGGHLKVLTNKAPNVAVLETHHGGILRNGFAFHWCDIAVCLNVTEDHLGVSNIETVGQMAKLKQALPERARHAVVLNADDKYCLAMIDSVRAEKTCLVSMEYSVDEMRAIPGNSNTCFCVLESIAGEEWMVIYDRDRRLAVMDVAAIPITFNATARFNISNAMHAALASYLLGTSIEMIRIALGDFSASNEATPGRLNIFDDLPFRIIMDYAHNPDGMRKISEFIDAQTVTGRKVLAFSGSADRTDETIRNVARSVAGHFDFYFCKQYAPDGFRNHRDTTHVLKLGLLESGVAEELTATRTYGKDVIFEILDSCEPGDLLVMLLGNVEKHQLAGYIEEYIQTLS